jgi:hypothetical protein
MYAGQGHGCLINRHLKQQLDIKDFNVLLGNETMPLDTLRWTVEQWMS